MVMTMLENNKCSVLVMITLPFSLCVCFKVRRPADFVLFFYFNLIQNLVHIKSNSQFAPRQDQLSLCCCQPNSRLLITTVILPYCLFNKIFQILFKWKTKRIIPVQRSSKNMKERLSLDLEDYSLAAPKALVKKIIFVFVFSSKVVFHV